MSEICGICDGKIGNYPHNKCSDVHDYREECINYLKWKRNRARKAWEWVKSELYEANVKPASQDKLDEALRD